MDEVAFWAPKLDLAPIREKHFEVLLGDLAADSLDKGINSLKLHRHRAVLTGRASGLGLDLLVLQESSQAHRAELSETARGLENLMAASGSKTPTT